MLKISGKIPIAISPFFWVTAGLIGWINSMGMKNTFAAIVIWVVVIFISILVHEFGHALTAKAFGQQPRIELVAFGGLTYPEGKKLRGWREFLVVLNGPLFGFGLFLVASFLLFSGFFTGVYTLYMLKIFQWVNLFWTLVNLLPVMPLDGGQLLRVILESACGAKGLKYAIFSSAIISISLSLFFFFIGLFIVGAIFFIFAFQNFGAWRSSRIISENDRDENLALEMKEIEELLIKNKKEEAIPRLEEIREKTKVGLLFNLTTQYLANFKAESQEYASVYALLKPIQKHLSSHSLIHLHRAAFEEKDYLLVTQIAGPCFQVDPEPEIAFRSAAASAMVNNVESTIGWLKAAVKGGFFDLKQELSSSSLFDRVRNDPLFKEFYFNLEK